MVVALGVLALGGLAAGSGSGAPRHVQVDSHLFKPVADALVTSAKPGRNFGAGAALGVDRRPLVRSYLRFKVRGLTTPVANATLRVYVTRFHGRGIAVRRIARRQWAERRITFRNAPPLASTVATFTIGATGWADADVTRLVRGNGVVELALTHAAPPGVISFASRETRSLAPQLLVATKPPADATAIVAAAGNMSCDPADPFYNGGNGTVDHCRAKSTSDLVVSAGADAVLALGDNQYECGGYDAFLQAYGPTWGRVKSITHPIPGNHDYGSDVAGTGCPANGGPAGYFRYFGAAAGDPTRGYYSFDLANWHLIALNSNCAAIGGCGAGSAQETWLKQDLATHHDVCTLAYWHQPRFVSGPADVPASVDAFWRDVVNAGVDVVLTAHTHMYERFAPVDANGNASESGAREFVVGSGGKSHHAIVTVQPNSEVRNIDTFGVLELTLRPASYDWKFVPIAGQTFTDSGSTACH